MEGRSLHTKNGRLLAGAGTALGIGLLLGWAASAGGDDPTTAAPPTTANVAAPTRVPVPAGLFEVAVQLDRERALGGRLAAGDRVGIVVSYEEQPDGERRSTTRLGLEGVLVTGVAFAQKDAEGVATQRSDDPSTAAVYPSSELVVTLALNPGQIEDVVHAAEFGTIWLTAGSSTTRPASAHVVTAVTTAPNAGGPTR